MKRRSYTHDFTGRALVQPAAGAAARARTKAVTVEQSAAWNICPSLWENVPHGTFSHKLSSLFLTTIGAASTVKLSTGLSSKS